MVTKNLGRVKLTYLCANGMCAVDDGRHAGMQPVVVYGLVEGSHPRRQVVPVILCVQEARNPVAANLAQAG